MTQKGNGLIIPVILVYLFVLVSVLAVHFYFNPPEEFELHSDIVSGQVVGKDNLKGIVTFTYRLELKTSCPIPHQHSIKENEYIYQFFASPFRPNVEIGDNVVLYYDEEKWDTPWDTYRIVPLISKIEIDFKECDPRNQYSFVWNRSTGEFYEENGCWEPSNNGD